jgi:ribulose-5-phosphate 4-epimerase/fuculose-1-phosphate aldolase
MEALDDYVKFCRIVGPWTDWFQGPGGNLSVKIKSSMFVKQSGIRIADTTRDFGWMLCSVDGLRKCLHEDNEDFTSTVTMRAPAAKENAKASMEAIFHALPSKYILHAHPTPLMTALCTPDSIFHIPTFKSIVVPYAKPGIPLANLINTVYNPSVSIYFLRNHGVLILADNLEEILIRMNSIRIHLFPAGIYTQIPTAAILASKIKSISEPPLLLRPTFLTSPIRSFLPFTPDIAVFFTQPIFCVKEYTLIKPSYIPQVISIDNHLYLVGETLEHCNILQELLLAYLSINSSYTIQLIDSDVESLRGWDKEKERVQNSK